MEMPAAPVAGRPIDTSPLAQPAQNAQVGEGLEVYSGNPVSGETERRTIGRTTSTSSTKVDHPGVAPSRSGTLKKNASLRKRTSLSRRGSKRSLRAGEIKGLGASDSDEFNFVFHTPVPTTGNPTDILANRFQAWRKLLKDLITYFREIQTSYESRSKALLKVTNVINNTQPPPIFLSQGGLSDALTTLRGFHKVSLTEANKARDIEDDVITQLNGLRNDLNQKIKEIKSLSDDFKNSVEKKKETTRKAVSSLQEALSVAENDPTTSAGKNDPYIIRLGVDRQVELQLEEENYLHRAYLNLEGSGRELESIVVGEIQKAYNALVGILRRETDHAHETIDDLRSGPIAMPKDLEWINFVQHDDHFVNPDVPLRQAQDIYYPGKFNPSAMDIRSGMLERKSKYLKSYTPGWYVLSPTHLHEFKSGDHLHTQTPVMSLFLLDQKLGSHSQPDATSHKFSFKGRQTGAMHRGHSWVFRAESHDTMMAWFDAIQILTERTTAERNAYVRRHAHSVSGASQRATSVSSDGIEEDEEDAEPFSGNLPNEQAALAPVKRPEPGGRFPSDVDVNRGLQAPLFPSSNGSSEVKDNLATTPSGPSGGRILPKGDDIETVDRQDYSEPTQVAHPSVTTTQQVSQQSNVHGPSKTPIQHHELPATSLSPSDPTNSTTDGPQSDLNNDGLLVATAVGSGAIGGAVVGVAHCQGEDSEVQQPTQLEKLVEVSPTTQQSVMSSTSAATSTDGVSREPSTTDTQSSIASTATEKTPVLKPTDHMFPSVLRHDTTISASELHVPGEFPPTPATEN